jgi:hypothetical protein
MFSKLLCAVVVALAVGQRTTSFEKAEIQNVDIFELKDGVTATTAKADSLNVRPNCSPVRLASLPRWSSAKIDQASSRQHSIKTRCADLASCCFA